MGRSASPVTPGTNPPTPTTDDAPVTPGAGSADLEVAVVNEGLKAQVAASENADLIARIAEQDRKIADLMTLTYQLSKNQIATTMPEKVELPKMVDALKKAPSVPVLTEEGWYVPAIHPTDRTAKA